MRNTNPWICVPNFDKLPTSLTPKDTDKYRVVAVDGWSVRQTNTNPEWWNVFDCFGTAMSYGDKTKEGAVRKLIARGHKLS